MDRNGGPAAPPRPPKLLPRVHRPRAPAPIMSTPISLVPAPVTAPLTPLNLTSRRRPPPLPQHTQLAELSTSTTATSVTLTEPRPDGERAANEYVDTPFRPPAVTELPVSAVSRVPQVSPHVSPAVKPSRTIAMRPSALPLAAVRPITKQPMSFTKELGATSATHPAARGDTTDGEPSVSDCPTRGSIICPECGRCRCEQCQMPRPLPSRWLCDNSCLCSAETVIDYTTCLCCVKALYYHCAGDHELERADEPCSCAGSGHRKAARWGCMAAMSVLLPCLCCYWPMRGCATVCATAYARHSLHGCQCPQHGAKTRQSRPHRPAAELTPEKRLLDSSPEY